MHSTTALALAALSTVQIGRAMPEAAAPPAAASWPAPHVIEASPLNITTTTMTSYTNTVHETLTISTPETTLTPSLSLTTQTSYTNTVLETLTISTPEATVSDAQAPLALTTETRYTNTLYVTSAVTSTTTVDCAPTSLTASCSDASVTSTHTHAPSSSSSTDIKASSTSIKSSSTSTPAPTSSLTTSWTTPSMSPSGNATFSYHPSPISSSSSVPVGTVPAMPTLSSSSVPEAPVSGAAEIGVAVSGLVFGFGAVVLGGLIL